MPVERARPAPRRVRCLACGLAEGNSANVQVLTFSLTRKAAEGTRSFGVIGLCDRCRREHDIRPLLAPRPPAA